MRIFNRLKIGFGMARRSGRVLRAYPKLLVFSFLLAVASLGLGSLTFVLTGGTGIQLLATVLIGGSAFAFGLLIGKALSGVAKTALYVYATENTAPEFLDDMDFGDVGGDSSASTHSLGGRFGGSGGDRI